MNKYQEALNKIRKKLTIVEKIKPQKSKKPQTLKETLDQAEGVSVTFACDKEIKTLQQLVDKETPKKIIVDKETDKEYINYNCPYCNETFIKKNKQFSDCVVHNVLVRDKNKWNYCPYCGKKLDWSDEND